MKTITQERIHLYVLQTQRVLKQVNSCDVLICTDNAYLTDICQSMLVSIQESLPESGVLGDKLRAGDAGAATSIHSAVFSSFNALSSLNETYFDKFVDSHGSNLDETDTAKARAQLEKIIADLDTIIKLTKSE